MAKNNFIPLVGGGTQMPASAEAVAADILRLDGAVSDLAEDVGTIENWDAGDIPYDSSENYNDGTVGGSLNDLKSAIGENGANILSAYPTDTASGAIASFPDGAAVPVKDLTVAITPAQDLHGQSNPWPAGGGVNKLSPLAAGTTTKKGINIVSDGNGTYRVYGTASAEVIVDTALPETTTIVNGMYLHLCNTQTASGFTFNLWTTSQTSIGGREPTVQYAKRDLTENAGEVAGSIRWYVATGITIDITISPMLVVASTNQTVFYPYSNICPISGWTQAKVTRTGKNLLPKMTAGTYSGNGVTVVVDDDGVAAMSGTTTAAGNAVIIPLTESVTLTQEMFDAGVFYHMNNSVLNVSFSPTLESTSYVTAFSAVANPINRTQQMQESMVGKTIDQIRFYVGNGVTLSGTYAPALMVGGTVTPYEPYSEPLIVTVDLDGTRYGGTLDVTTGVLTVEYVKKTITTFDGAWGAQPTGNYAVYKAFSDTNHERNYISASKMKSNIFTYESVSRDNAPLWGYGGSDGAPETQTFVLPGTITSLAEANAWLANNPTECTFKLATPTTYQLTPTEVSTLLGANNIWADTGDATVNYRADATLYIEKLTGSTEDDMVADANIANGQYFMVGNRLFLATAAIAAGAQLTIGTNCTETNLAAALNALNS